MGTRWLCHIIDVETLGGDLHLRHILQYEFPKIVVFYPSGYHHHRFTYKWQQQLGTHSLFQGIDFAIEHKQPRGENQHLKTMSRGVVHDTVAYTQMQAIVGALVMPMEIHDKCYRHLTAKPQPVACIEGALVGGGVMNGNVEFLGQRHRFLQPLVGHRLDVTAEGTVVACPEIRFPTMHLLVGETQIEEVGCQFAANRHQLT